MYFPHLSALVLSQHRVRAILQLFMVMLQFLSEFTSSTITAECYMQDREEEKTGDSVYN